MVSMHLVHHVQNASQFISQHRKYDCARALVALQAAEHRQITRVPLINVRTVDPECPKRPVALVSSHRAVRTAKRACCPDL